MKNTKAILFLFCLVSPLGNCSSLLAEESERIRLRNDVQGLLNTWDADRAEKRMRIYFMDPRVSRDPPPKIDMIPCNAAIVIQIDGRRYADWCKRFLATLLKNKWSYAHERSLSFYMIEVIAPWDGTLLRIGVSRDLRILI